MHASVRDSLSKIKVYILKNVLPAFVNHAVLFCNLVSFILLLFVIVYDYSKRKQDCKNT